MNFTSIIKYCVISLILGLLGIVAWSQVKQKVAAESEKIEFEFQTNKKIKIESQNQPKVSQNQPPYDNWSEYESVRERIFTLKLSKDLFGLIQIEDEVEATWGITQPIDIFGRNLYAGLMYEICGGISSYDFKNNEQYFLARKCTERALEKRDKMPVQQEIDLVSFLSGTTEYNLKLASKDEWEKDRKERAEYWLHAWQRLENEFDKNYNFEANRPINHQNLTPQEKAKIEIYTKQYTLHKLRDSFFKQFKEFLVNAYAMQPYNSIELEGLLKKFVSDTELKKSILKEVGQKITEQTSQEGKKN